MVDLAAKKTTESKKRKIKKKPRPVPPTGGGQGSMLNSMGGANSRG